VKLVYVLRPTIGFPFHIGKSLVILSLIFICNLFLLLWIGAKKGGSGPDNSGPLEALQKRHIIYYNKYINKEPG
jgi:hypothetical protein